MCRRSSARRARHGKEPGDRDAARQQRATATKPLPASIAACRRRRGGALFSDATGTVHLAAIESLPLPLQTRLVRAISDADRAHSTERLRARVLASTSADLVAAVAAGTFRRDLYDIISLITIHLPPLRDRRDDLPLLDSALYPDDQRQAEPQHSRPRRSGREESCRSTRGRATSASSNAS